MNQSKAGLKGSGQSKLCKARTEKKKKNSRKISKKQVLKKLLMQKRDVRENSQQGGRTVKDRKSKNLGG